MSNETPGEDDKTCTSSDSGEGKDETAGVESDVDGAVGGEPVRVTASKDGLSATVPVAATALIRLPASPPSTTFLGVVGRAGSGRAAAELTNAGE